MPLADAVTGIGVAIHVIAVIAMAGGLIALPIAQAGARRRGGHAEGRELRLVRHLINPALLVTLLAGIVVAADKGVFGEFYVSFGIVATLVIGGIVGGFVVPRLRRLADAEGKAYDDLSTQVIGAAWVCVLLLIATVGVMSAHG
jgi:uncharacterized membrane protein